MQRMIIAALVVLLAASLVAWRSWSRDQSRTQKQILTVERMKRINSALREYRETHDDVPADLETLARSLNSDDTARFGGFVDHWGQPFVYESDGNQFLLASLGSDGRRDNPRATTTEAQEPLNVCGDFAADQVLTSDGWISACYKY
ncbi:hypothetical protein ABI59_07990 [Acidobacteria bacterium Mor1]|nr:hypothetical protein ABI59_07990 [Acidobacteria bacterium Mor1]